MEHAVAVRFARQRERQRVGFGRQRRRTNRDAARCGRLRGDAQLVDVGERVDRIASFARRRLHRRGRHIRHAGAEGARHLAGLLFGRRVDGAAAAKRGELPQLRERLRREQHSMLDGAAAVAVHFHHRRHVKATRAGEYRKDDEACTRETHSHRMP